MARVASATSAADHWRFPVFPGNVAAWCWADWKRCVTYWEWIKLIVTAFLISCALTASTFALWYAVK
jgi:hypothetical protein